MGTMTAYLVANPPARAQYRRGRRATPTGTIVIHSFEIAPDLVGEDLGAEKGAWIIRNRTDAAGSYHLLGDRDSHILVVPLDWEAFHDGTGSNAWSIGISLALTAAWFRAASDEEKLWYLARLATMCREASDWLEVHHGITVPARRLTKASQREAGICTHMDREMWEGTPGRRTDPWGNSDAMWHLFLTLYEDTARSPEDDMPLTDADIDRIAERVQLKLLVEDTRWLDWRLAGAAIKAAELRNSLASLVRRITGTKEIVDGAKQHRLDEKTGAAIQQAVAPKDGG